MRRFLDRLYLGAAVLGAVAMVGTLLFVVLSIVGRVFDWYVPGTDAYAGYCMAASGFLALAHTLKRGEHIHVTLVHEHLAGARARALEVFALGVAALLGLAFAYYSARLAWQSWDFNDVSTANDATPLWIPQLTMAAGAVVFAIALVDELVLQLAGKRVKVVPAEALRNE
ncbi:MAG TPA: TRAP transporter small permease [Casimicrobiaceae bacterium]|jgi:TRAP-type C4-dicarboxylate transport system permease small subunit